jgi:hypothetical protein
MTTELASMEKKSSVCLEKMTLESLDNFDRMSTLGWLRRRCQVNADATWAKEEATCDEGAGCKGRHIM